MCFNLSEKYIWIFDQGLGDNSDCFIAGLRVNGGLNTGLIVKVNRDLKVNIDLNSVMDCLLRSDQFTLKECAVISQLRRSSINYVLDLKNRGYMPQILFWCETVCVDSSINCAGSTILKKLLLTEHLQTNLYFNHS
ncbi:hypothetical protein AVEN_73673-1 [Araneus ventricosus]|uniref:Uncharacterized protein n=1 Tax=Araneus ventricosus TaxID=182803 RepID=A0A4Y2HQ59_ARAVE|nr:hypothetical protein AVEN_73673-1 [Araneus ventricosus]